MWKFKKDFSGQTLSTVDGVLVHAGNITDDKVERLIKQRPSLAHYFEKTGEEPAKGVKKPATKKKK